MPHEKSQLENIALPPSEEETANQNAVPTLPPGFSLGRQLTTKSKLTPRAETLKYLLPNYQSGVDRVSQEEKENKARAEKEGMNYDLYLSIKEKLAPEFQEKLNRNISNYDILKKGDLFKLIEKDPNLYTPNPKDIQFIANNLKEFFPNLKEDDYPQLGIFLNSFIHAYFNSVPQEKRKDLKLFLVNAEKLGCIGAELSFGTLKVKEAGSSFGSDAHGSAILEAEKLGAYAGMNAYENARIIVKEAKKCFGHQAHGSAILEAEKVEDGAGEWAHESAHIIVKEAGGWVGYSVHGDATITITEKYGSIGTNRRDNSKIILPDGRVLKAGENV